LRRAALLQDDDAVAEQADRDLVEARLLLRRLAEKVDLLGQIPSNELPGTVEGMRAEIERLRRRQAQLERKPRMDRSASDDDALEHLVPHISMLLGRLQQMESMGR
jgi:hypothetical protein